MHQIEHLEEIERVTDLRVHLEDAIGFCLEELGFPTRHHAVSYIGRIRGTLPDEIIVTLEDGTQKVYQQ